MAEVIPAWLNLDAVCPTELRDRAAELAGRIEAFEEAFGGLADEARQVLAELDAHLPRSPEIDSSYGLFSPFTGHARLYEALFSISERAEDVLR